MDLGWQDFAAIAIVFAASLHLARIAWKAVAGKPASHCGSACVSCPSRRGTRTDGSVRARGQIVTIGGLDSRRRDVDP